MRGLARLSGFSNARTFWSRNVNEKGSTVGAAPYWVYRVVIALLVVALGVLVYLYATPRLGRRAGP